VMLARRTEQARTILFLLDQILLVPAFAAAWWLKRSVVFADPSLNAATYMRLYAASIPFLAIALSLSGLYRLSLERRRSRLVRTRELLRGGVVATATVILVGFFMKPYVERPDGTLVAVSYSRAIQFLYFVTSMLALWGSRAIVARVSRRMGLAPGRGWQVLVFGMSRRVLKVLSVFRRQRHLGMSVIGIATDEEVPEDVGPRIGFDEAFALVEQGRVDHLVVEAESLDDARLAHILTLADREGVSVHVTSALFPSVHLVGTWERVGGVPLLGFVSRELPFGARATKRVFDVVVSTVGLVVLALPMLGIAALVKLTSGGPVFFRQKRVGEGGRVFEMLKFRTMRPDAETGTGPVWATADDPRCTRFGAFLRRWNIDEFPQLLNVLAGHMSLVGPRPERPEFVGGFKSRIPRYAHKHWVKPGITGWAQVHGLRGNTSLRDRIDHDVYYIEHWSLLLDIRILVRTLWDGYANAA